jgi:hypothetical protein
VTASESNEDTQSSAAGRPGDVSHSGSPAVTRCARCRAALTESELQQLAALTESERISPQERFFCGGCYSVLMLRLRAAAHASGRPSARGSYPTAAVGAMFGGCLGALAWWVVTVLTRTNLGIGALPIGYLVGYGAVRGAGGQRGRRLQVLAVAVSLASFLVAVYLVNMTFIDLTLIAKGQAPYVHFPPPDVGTFLDVVIGDFGLTKVAFLAIVLYDAWIIPRRGGVSPSE